MTSLGGMGNSWAVEMVILVVMCFVSMLCDLYAIVEYMYISESC